MNNDQKKLLKELQKQGFTIRYSKKGYPMVHTANGDFVAKLAQTPSDWRSWKNALAALRRHGFKWPP